MSFSYKTPLHHPSLDAWGLARSTRVWMVDGSYKPVQDIERGDVVMGVTFRKEDWFKPHMDGTSEHCKVMRPILCGRVILGVRETHARPWELTFGSHEKASEARRLVAGADTAVYTDPVSVEANARDLSRLRTALPNRRVESRYLDDKMIDWKASKRKGELVWRSPPHAGEPIGDMAVTIPFEAFGGQRGQFSTEDRDYTRYSFSQAREVRPLTESFPLYQFAVQPDLDPESGLPRRCNMIVQTPFSDKKRESTIVEDSLSDEFLQSDEEELKAKWDEYVKNREEQDRPAKQSKTKHEARMQGSFWESKKPKMQKGLQKLGVNEWLNGGILIDVPIPPAMIEGLDNRNQTDDA